MCKRKIQQRRKTTKREPIGMIVRVRTTLTTSQPPLVERKQPTIRCLKTARVLKQEVRRQAWP
jgi:hypothetical protein